MISNTKKTSVGLRMLSVLAMTLFLGGCNQTAKTNSVVIDPACMAWPNVTYSSKDTPETQTQARANNAAKAVYCG